MERLIDLEEKKKGGRGGQFSRSNKRLCFTGRRKRAEGSNRRGTGLEGQRAESSSVLRNSPVAVELFSGGTEVRMISLRKKEKRKIKDEGVLDICTLSGQHLRLSPRWPDAGCRVTIHLSIQTVMTLCRKTLNILKLP